MLRFSFTISIFVMSFIGKNDAIDKRDSYLLRAGIFFALLGDYFLVVTQNFPPGVIVFTISQLLHCCRLVNVKYMLLTLLVSLLFFLVSPEGLGIVNRLSLIYAICLLFAIGGAVRAYITKKYKAPNRHFILVAMLFFVICDINVVLYNTPALKSHMITFLWLIWVFYLPAQLLLALSRIELS